MSVAKEVQTRLHQLNKALESGTYIQIRHMLNGLTPAEIARLIESMQPNARLILWRLINTEASGEVLQYLNEDIINQIVKGMDTDDLTAVLEKLDTDDLADILQTLPKTVTKQVLNSLDSLNRKRIEMVLNYPNDTAGGLMNTDTITVRPNITLDVVQRYLRRYKEIPDMTDNILVINRKDQFVGILPLTKLLLNEPSMTVREAMITDVETIPANMHQNNVAQIFEQHALVSAPVVDENQVLLGRITIDDVVDVIREDAQHSIMSMAGLNEEEDVFAPILTATRRRSVWLGINALTAFIAAAVMGLFSATIEKVVALAILSPIVASMGGIAGTQTLTLVIRGMALGQVGFANARVLLRREVLIGMLNGTAWAMIIGSAAALWWHDSVIGFIIAAAIVINLIMAAISGATLPLILKRLDIDPAISGGVILTTVTDVVGFASFLGLATLVY
ncbi:MAG TPA: magnesium transporter [Pseudomonadales bacterium]|nr:magnesium transporter [Pseudomonadales bacterium]